ncbi:MAG: hypothetical protein WC356_03105 [Candidatus Micrarchaeia archaeon]|jgi:hypothetical protein
MDWIILTLILSLMSLGVVSILYMIARAFSLNGLENWCKSEFMEILISGLIIIAVIGFIQGILLLSNEVLNEMHPENVGVIILSSDPASSAILETYNIIEPVKKTYTNVFTFHFVLSLANELEIIGFKLESAISLIPAVGYFGKAIPGALLGTLQWILKVLGIFIMWMYFFIEVIKFGDYLAVILLPLGIVCRAFPPTRGAGAMFIAIALGLSLVLPASFIMTIYAIGDYGQTLDPFGGETIEEYNTILETLCIGNNLGSIGLIRKMAESLDYEGIMKMANDSGFFIMMFKIFISPVIALIITYTFIRSFGMMLGADLAEIGRGLIKLI